MTITNNDGIEPSRVLTNIEQRRLLLRYLISHNRQHIDEFLEERDLEYRVNKSQLEGLLDGYINDEQIELAEVVGLLNRIEGWGRQHVYLYDVPRAISSEWRSLSTLRTSLNRQGVEHLLEHPLPLILPPSRTLSAVEANDNYIRFVWVETRQSQTRAPEEDYEDRSSTIADEPSIEEFIQWRAYKVRLTRGLIIFEWDLGASEAMLRIQQLPQGRQSYVDARVELEAELQKYFPIEYFEKLDLGRALRNIESSNETRRHHMTFATLNRGMVSITSRGSRSDVLDSDPDIASARTALGTSTSSRSGKLYWLRSDPKPSAEVYTHLHCQDENDQRIGIFAEHTESDVRHVLSRIRFHSR